VSIEFIEEPAYKVATGKIEGRIRVSIATGRDVDCNLYFKATEPGMEAEVPGFALVNTPSEFRADAGSSQVPVRFYLDCSNANAGTYDIHAVVNVSGTGVQGSVKSEGIIVP
jgi:hypothetical protein